MRKESNERDRKLELCDRMFCETRESLAERLYASPNPHQVLKL